MSTGLQNQRGLSLVEVAFVIATVFLVGMVLLPRTTGCKGRSQRIACTSTLKQVGLAYRLYANDHSNQFPFAVSNELGGSLAFANTPEVFRHYEALSNELVTPGVLICNLDRGRVRRDNFDTGLSNKNVSYFAGLDAHEEQPQSILSGDRNITGGRLTNGFLRLITPKDTLGWTKDLHNQEGNIGLGDGSVQQVTRARLEKQVQAQPLPVIRLAIP
jgi:hypothetical protein